VGLGDGEGIEFVLEGAGALGLGDTEEFELGLGERSGAGLTSGSRGTLIVEGSFGRFGLFSLLSTAGFSIVLEGFPEIVSGLFGNFPSEKEWSLLFSAGLGTLLSTVVPGVGIFGVGGTFGPIFKNP
jgi:hypothetical protein